MSASGRLCVCVRKITLSVHRKQKFTLREIMASSECMAAKLPTLVTSKNEGGAFYQEPFMHLIKGVLRSLAQITSC